MTNKPFFIMGIDMNKEKRERNTIKFCDMM